MPFSDRVKCREIAINLCQAEGERLTNLDVILDESAAIDSAGQIQYRPYITAAIEIEQTPYFQEIGEAEGVKFSGMLLPIASLKALQARLDKKYGWTVPAGFEALPAGSDPSTGEPGGDGEESASSGFVTVFAPVVTVQKVSLYG